MDLSRYKTSTLMTLFSILVILIINIFFVVISSYFFRKEAIEEAKDKAGLILDKNMSVHEYFTNELKPILFEALKDTIARGNYFEHAWMSSSYAIIKLDKYFLKRNKFGYYYKDATINARNNKNEADSLEVVYLNKLINQPNTPEKEEGIITLDETKYYYLLKKGETMEKACMRCHSSPEIAPKPLVETYGNTQSFNRKVGDLISVISIRIPLNQAYQRATHNILIISICMSMVVFVIIFIYLFIQKQFIFKPIEILQEQSLAIAKDKSLLGKSININATKDLGDFVHAFNLMSQRIYEHQSLLEQRVLEKTLDLENKVKKVQELSLSKDRFISILGHDLKSPFNAIIGFTEILLKNLHKYDNEKIEKQLQIINKSAQNTYKLLDDILLWAKANSGKIQFVPQKQNFLDAVGLVLEGLKPAADNKKITINNFADSNMLVYADTDMLHTILRNLIANAIKFTYTNGQINIYAVQNSTGTTITVADNGVGIDAETMPRLFDMSQIITSVGTANEKGTGLGLLLCKEFVEKHGGKIWVESEWGKGSTFKFIVPSKNKI